MSRQGQVLPKLVSLITTPAPCKEEDVVTWTYTKIPGSGTLPCLRQPYDHVRLNVGRPTNLTKSFVQWAVENEHGDLGLTGAPRQELSPAGAPLPPPSALALKLKRPENAPLLGDQINGIVEFAEDNICMARMRIDNLHLVTTVEDLAAPLGDRLPYNIISFFDAAIDAIRAQPDDTRVIGLLAIAAVSTRRYIRGIEFSKVQDAVREFNRTSDDFQVECPKVEGVLLATQGFLRAIPQDPQEETRLLAYHEAFHAYIVENYNEQLRWWMEMNLRFDSSWFKKFSRVKTMPVDKGRGGIKIPVRRVDSGLEKRAPPKVDGTSRRPTWRLKPTRSRTMAV
jgi:hypothetical protein